MALIGPLSDILGFITETCPKLVIDYLLESTDSTSEVRKRINNLPLGSFVKVHLSDDIFALEQVFNTKNRNECFLESHRKYIDFQLNLLGVEQMELTAPIYLTKDGEYDQDKDLIMYKMTNETSKIIMRANDLSVYFPNDVHLGIGMYETPNLIRKTVVKVPLELYGLS